MDDAYAAKMRTHRIAANKSRKITPTLIADMAADIFFLLPTKPLFFFFSINSYDLQQFFSLFFAAQQVRAKRA